MNENYEVVVGLEVHAELKTQSKIFCSCSTAFGAEPNTQICPGCAGFPGMLPVLNRRVVEIAIMAGLALNCEIAEICRFDRKSYFYPDLPRAYQISQLDLPICLHGYLEIDLEGKKKRIGITRAHMEEDAGK
ncbi:MAG: Asp-tRNA(Asn)/Glu-tRNA(Gln) amidotransferase GatCAB subunit B, partial [Syntrophomonadaceae bacterium]